MPSGGNGMDDKEGPGADGFRDEKVEIDVPSGLPAVQKAPPVPVHRPAPAPGAAGGGIRTGAGGGIKTSDAGGTDGGGIKTGGEAKNVVKRPRPLVKKKE